LILFATEVGDEIAYWKLPAKSQSIQTVGPQSVPQYSFRISLIATQLTRAMKFQRYGARVGTQPSALANSCFTVISFF
jgi:hypothetical protein